MKRAMTILGPCEPERVCNKLPVTDGDKKFTEKMVPGYTGEFKVSSRSLQWL